MEAIVLYALDGCTEGADLSVNRLHARLFNTWPVEGPTGEHAGATYLQKDKLSYGYINNTEGILHTEYAITVLLHVYPETDGTLVYFGDDTSNLTLSLADNELRFRYIATDENGGVTETEVKSLAMNAYDQWYYVAATYDYNAEQLRLSVNGAVVAAALPRVTLPTDRDVYFGIGMELTDSFAGRMSCLQVYDRALDAAEITEKEQCPSGVGSGVEGKTRQMPNSKLFFLFLDHCIH